MSSPFQKKFSAKSPFGITTSNLTDPPGSKNIIVTKTADYMGKQVPVEGYTAGKPGTVDKVRGTTEQLFPLLTDDQKAKISGEGYNANSLEGYQQYVKNYYAGTLPSQRVNYTGEVTKKPGTTKTKVKLYPRPEGMEGEGKLPSIEISDWFKSRNDREGFQAYLDKYGFKRKKRNTKTKTETVTTPGTETYTGLRRTE